MYKHVLYFANLFNLKVAVHKYAEDVASNSTVPQGVQENKLSFNLDTLKSMPNDIMASNYITYTLPMVTTGKGGGVGSSRRVFDLGNGTVIKLAYNRAGKAQNFMEARIFGQSNMLATVYDMSPDGLWIISEKITPFTNVDDFTVSTGIPEKLLSEGGLREFLTRPTPDLLKTLSVRYDLEPDAVGFLQNLTSLSSKLNLIFGDLIDPVHWGKAADGTFKTYDYGLDGSTFSAFYNKSGFKKVLPDEQAPRYDDIDELTKTNAM